MEDAKIAYVCNRLAVEYPSGPYREEFAGWLVTIMDDPEAEPWETVTLMYRAYLSGWRHSCSAFGLSYIGLDV